MVNYQKDPIMKVIVLSLLAWIGFVNSLQLIWPANGSKWFIDCDAFHQQSDLL